jgi:hypothetical protein
MMRSHWKHHDPFGPFSLSFSALSCSWLRTGALLSVIGIWRLALAARTRSQPIFLATGALVLVIGLTMRSSVAVVLGMIVMGSAVSGAGPHSPTAAMVHTWMWLRKS